MADPSESGFSFSTLAPDQLCDRQLRELGPAYLDHLHSIARFGAADRFDLGTLDEVDSWWRLAPQATQERLDPTNSGLVSRLIRALANAVSATPEY